MVEQQRIGLHRARLAVRARDRLRVDLVAEVGAVGLAPRDQRVGERLERGVREIRLSERRLDRGQEALGRRQRREHEAAEPQRSRALQDLTA